MLAMTCCCAALAQEAAVPAPPPAAEAAQPAQAAPEPPAASAGCALPASTVIELEVVEGVSSATAKADDFFKMRVATAVRSGETILIPVDTPVVGQVIDARKAGFGGRPGKLILAARYIDLPQGRLKLRSTLGAAGTDHSQASIAAAIAVGVIGLVVHGADVELRTGTRMSAKTAEAATIALPAATPPPPPTPQGSETP